MCRRSRDIGPCEANSDRLAGSIDIVAVKLADAVFEASNYRRQRQTTGRRRGPVDRPLLLGRIEEAQRNSTAIVRERHFVDIAETVEYAAIGRGCGEFLPLAVLRAAHLVGYCPGAAEEIEIVTPV